MNIFWDMRVSRFFQNLCKMCGQNCAFEYLLVSPSSWSAVSWICFFKTFQSNSKIETDCKKNLIQPTFTFSRRFLSAHSRWDCPWNYLIYGIFRSGNSARTLKHPKNSCANTWSVQIRITTVREISRKCFMFSECKQSIS